MKGYLWYGTSKYPTELTDEAKKLFNNFIEKCRQELSVKSGGYQLAPPEPNLTHLYVAGDGWSIETEGD